MSLEKKDASSFAGALGGSSRVPSSHHESEGDILPRAHRGGPRFAFFDEKSALSTQSARKTSFGRKYNTII